MAENVELEALDQLLHSEGWKILTSVVAKEWGNEEGGGAYFAKAVSDAVKELNGATEHLRQICAAQREIQRVMSWPSKRVELLHLAAQRPSESPSRRGTL